MLQNLLGEVKWQLLCDKYERDYINSINENIFICIYNLFEKYYFYYIDDIIVNYLELFEKDYDYVEKKILELKEELGNVFVFIIGNNVRYLEKI